MKMDSNLKRSIILEHYSNPHNRGLIDDKTYKKVNMNNESCIDEVNLMLKIENDIIVDAKFKTFGCAAAIATSSTATKMVIGMTIEEALKLTNKKVVEECIIAYQSRKRNFGDVKE